MPALRIIRRLVDLLDVNPAGLAVGDVPTWDGSEFTMDASGGGGGPPTGPAGGVLDGTYPNPGLAAAVAGSGLSEAADVLSVNVDGATITIAADTLGVPTNGIGSTQLADNAVDTNAIQANAVTAAKVAADVATQAELDAVVANAVNDGDAAGGVLGGTYPNPAFAVDVELNTANR